VTSVVGAGRRRGGGPLRAVAAWLPVAACVFVYFVLQAGGLTLERERSIDFRCISEEYGLVPAELAHPGRRATDVFCEPGESAEDDGHGHERADARMPADAPAAITPLTSMSMHGSALHLALTMLVAAALAVPLSRAFRHPLAVPGLFLLGGLVSAGALVAVAPDMGIANVGASGGVAALLGAALARLPRESVTYFAVPVLVLALLAAGAQLLIAALDLGQPVAGDGGGIAYWTPLAGLAAGWLVARRRTRPSPA
jgi:membrane associated rhomboid family serine protease